MSENTGKNENAGLSQYMSEVIKKLKAPFPYAETEWKVQATTADKTRGLAVVYINSRAIQNRLDEIVGSFDWQNEYMPWQDKAQICAISIFDKSRGIWVRKCDGAENTDYEPVKGGLSDSFKRAAVMWGLGRYLYDIDSIWVEIETKGKSSVIKESERKRLEAHYNRFVTSIANSAPTGDGEKKTPPQNSAGNSNSQRSGAGKPNDYTKQPQKRSAEYDYEIKSAAPGDKSICLKLIDKNGAEITAYAKKGSPGIKTGVCIRNAKMDEKQASFGKYYILDKYEVLDKAA